MRHRLFTNKLTAVSAKAAMAAAALTVGAVLLASCSSSATDDNASTDNGTSTTAVSDNGTSTTAASGSDEDQIKKVTLDFVTASNMGKVSDLEPLVCSEMAASVPVGQDLPESTQKAQIDSFGEITVTGDTATTRVTLSAVDDDTMNPESVDMLYVNQDGWKICQ